MHFPGLPRRPRYLARREQGYRAGKPASRDRVHPRREDDDHAGLFVPGLIDTKRGTCSNMPVVYMVVAHRLGWPLKAGGCSATPLGTPVA